MPSAHGTSGSGALHRNDAENPPLLSSEEFATLLGVPLPTIYRWRSRHQGPVGFWLRCPHVATKVRLVLVKDPRPVERQGGELA